VAREVPKLDLSGYSAVMEVFVERIAIVWMQRLDFLGDRASAAGP
jgi:hypothetical protein